MNQVMQPNDLLGDIDRLQGNNVVILGDVMLDEYIFGSVERISPEAPVPIVRIEKEEYRLGGAGNVAKNITSLGGNARIFGSLGEDSASERIREMFQEHGIQDYCLQECDRPTTRKTRIIAQQQQIVRIDRESACLPSETGLELLIKGVSHALETSDVLIISDYGKGVVSGPVMDRLRSVCASLPHKPRIIVDPKPKNYPAYVGVSLLTPNIKEAGIEKMGRHSGTDDREEDFIKDIFQAGQHLLRELQSQELLITLGARGMMLFQSPMDAVHIPTAAIKVYDVTGAGDTVIAVLGLALASKLDSLTGCLLANYAAGIVVGQIGATDVTTEQLQDAVCSWPSIQLQRHVLSKN